MKIIILAALLLFAVACYDDRTAPSSDTTFPDQWKWGIVQSPDTGLCYETATIQIDQGNDAKGYMGMHLIDCSYASPFHHKSNTKGR